MNYSHIQEKNTDTKKIASAVLTAMLLVLPMQVGAATPPSAPTTPGSQSGPSVQQYTVYKASHTPTIDGDTSEFDSVSPITLNIAGRGTVGTYRIVYTTTGLYISGDVLDNDLNAVSNVDGGKLWEDDSIELFFDMDHNLGDKMTTNDYKFFVNALNAHRAANAGDQSYASAVQVVGKVNDTAGNDTGYSIEMHIPWSTVGAGTPPNGAIVGFDIAINDRDKDGVRHSTIWANQDGTASYNDPSGWGMLTFSSQIVSTKVPESVVSPDEEVTTSEETETNGSAGQSGSGSTNGTTEETETTPTTPTQPEPPVQEQTEDTPSTPTEPETPSSTQESTSSGSTGSGSQSSSNENSGGNSGSNTSGSSGSTSTDATADTTTTTTETEEEATPPASPTTPTGPSSDSNESTTSTTSGGGGGGSTTTTQSSGGSGGGGGGGGSTTTVASTGGGGGGGGGYAPITTSTTSDAKSNNGKALGKEKNGKGGHVDGSTDNTVFVASYHFNTNLTKTDENTDVLKLQELLATDATIYPEAIVSGYYGTLTTKAVQRFQCKHNIVCSGDESSTGYGSVGPKTREKLNEAYGQSTVATVEAVASVSTSVSPVTVASTETSYQFNSNLYRGLENEEVKKLQEFLALDAEVYPEGITSGYYGKLTEKAVERYQCKHNVVCGGSANKTGYGVVGPKTRATINATSGTYASTTTVAPTHSNTADTTDIAQAIALALAQVAELQKQLNNLN